MKKAAPKRQTSQAKRIEELESQVALVAWEHEKLVHFIKMLIAQQMMQHPQVQQAMASDLANRMGSLNLQQQQ